MRPFGGTFVPVVLSAWYINNLGARRRAGGLVGNKLREGRASLLSHSPSDTQLTKRTSQPFTFLIFFSSQLLFTSQLFSFFLSPCTMIPLDFLRDCIDIAAQKGGTECPICSATTTNMDYHTGDRWPRRSAYPRRLGQFASHPIAQALDRQVYEYFDSIAIK